MPSLFYCSQDYQFYPAELEDLQERDANAFKVTLARAFAACYLQRAYEYQVPFREPQTEEDTPEALEAERVAEQAIIDNGACCLFTVSKRDARRFNLFCHMTLCNPGVSSRTSQAVGTGDLGVGTGGGRPTTYVTTHPPALSGWPSCCSSASLCHFVPAGRILPSS